MVTHSSVLAWRIPETGKPGGLPSIGSHRVGHDWGDLAVAAAVTNENYIYLRCTTWCFGIHIDSEIIAKIKLINIRITSELLFLLFCVWWEHLRCTLLASFYYTIQYKTANCIHVAVDYISRGYPSCTTKILYTLTNFLFLLPPQALATTMPLFAIWVWLF